MAAPEATPVQLAEPTQLSDAELVEGVRAGDELAFQTLYDRYFRRVYDFADRRLRNRADTEETVQEIFFNLFSSIHTFRGEAPFGAWVFGVTRRTIANRFRRKQQTTVPLSEDDVASPLGTNTLRRDPDPLEAYEYRERLARMQAAAAHDLTEDQRQLFDLHHLRNHSISDIAQQLSKTEDSVKSNLYRARKLLLAR